MFDAQEGEVQKANAAGGAPGKPGAAAIWHLRIRFEKRFECAWITDRQIEASRVAISRFIKRGGSFGSGFSRTSPSPKARGKPAMGKGKALRKSGFAVVKPGRIMFEMAGVDEVTAKEAMTLAAHKLPIPTKFVTRAGGM